jgi:hypothetical protein
VDCSSLCRGAAEEQSRRDERALLAICTGEF